MEGLKPLDEARQGEEGEESASSPEGMGHAANPRVSWPAATSNREKSTPPKQVFR